MTFCLHHFPPGDPVSARARPIAWKRFLPRPSLLLRLVEIHLASVERLRGLLVKRLTGPPDRVLAEWVIEDPASDLALRYGIDPDILGQSLADSFGQSGVRSEDAVDNIPALYLVASSPIPIKSSGAAGVPPPPPRLTPLAVRVLRKRLAIEPSSEDPGIPRNQPNHHGNHATDHILPSLSHNLPSLSNRETRAFAQSHTTKNRCHRAIRPRVTTKT